jgi:hypothetical protein
MKGMGATTKTLYDTDFVEWTARTAELLRQGRFDEVDLEHVVEEIEDLGRSERLAMRSQLRRMLAHLIKMRIQPERAGASWRGSVASARIEILDRITDSPSLRRHAETSLPRLYREAVELALAETNLAAHAKELDIPAKCPYTLDELLQGDLGDRGLR